MIGERLKKIRCMANKTQKEIAKDLKISQQRYNHYELSRNEPDSLMLKQLSEYFNVSSDYLLGLSNIPRPHEKNKKITLEDFAEAEGIFDEKQIGLLRDFTELIKTQEKYNRSQTASVAIAARSDKQIGQPEISKEKAQAFKKYVDEHEQEILDYMDKLDL